MINYDAKISILFIYWLRISLLLVFSIIIVGGLTRLTNSGLSITEWELFSGILPPLSYQSWSNYFELYKQIPQYKFINPNMTLDEFKVIFYWEYFHRVLARIIGIFFLIPLIYFYFTKKIENKYLLPCFLIFFLILTQGLIGWFMVESGLVNKVTVSHYRLSIHLTMAFIIISIIFWVLINFKRETNKFFFNISQKHLPFIILIFLIFLQIIFGAFVSGLDAGKIYQTWPMMGNSFFPNDLKISRINDLIDFNSHSLVQFYHRLLAYIISLYVLILSFMIIKFRIKRLYSPILLLGIFIIIQILLGIFTLISGLNIYVASAHQISSVILVLSSINLYYFYVK